MSQARPEHVMASAITKAIGEMSIESPLTWKIVEEQIMPVVKVEVDLVLHYLEQRRKYEGDTT